MKELARTESQTVFTVLMAAYVLLLYRYTNQSDVLVGVPSACRDQREFEDVRIYHLYLLIVTNYVSMYGAILLLFLCCMKWYGIASYMLYITFATSIHLSIYLYIHVCVCI